MKTQLETPGPTASLLAHGVVEDMKREDAKGFKTLKTRWDKRWRMKDGEWKMKVRLVGREYKWAEHREDLFSPGATHSASRVIDFLALKMGLETFEADVVDAYCQAPEHEEVVVEPAPEYLERHAKAGRDTDIVWRLRRQLPGRGAAGQSWVEHVAGILVNKLSFVTTAPQFYWSSERIVALELHMDDIHGAATPSGREKFVKDLALEINFKGGDRCETGKPYEHLKRPRLPMSGETRIQPNPKYLESVANQLGLTCAKTRPTPGVLPHCAAMDATPLLTADDTRACIDAVLVHSPERFWNISDSLSTSPFSATQWLRWALRRELDWGKAKTLWPQEVVRERGLQIKSIASKANKADLGTKVLPVARLNALRGACGIVVPGELSKDAVESENELYPD